MRESGLTGSCQVVSGSGLGFGTWLGKPELPGAQSSVVAPEHPNKMSLDTEREWWYPSLLWGLRPSLPSCWGLEMRGGGGRGSPSLFSG